MNADFAISPEGSTFEEFHDRHLDAKDGKRLRWMADFYRAKEGIMFHREAPLKWRVLELAKCKSWGNRNRDYVSNENGDPMKQRQIATILEVSYKRVSEAVDELVEEGYLAREGQIIFVIDDPAAARRQGTKRRIKGEPKSGTGWILSEEKAKFYTAWSEHDPEQFQQYQKLQAEIEEKRAEERRLEQAAWTWYQEQENKSGTGWTNDSEDPERGGQNVRNGVDESSGTGRTEDGPILNGFTSYTEQLASSPESSPEKLVAEAVAEAQAVEKSSFAELPGVRSRAVRVAAGKLGTVAPAHRLFVFGKFKADLLQLASRRENKPKNWGIVVIVMEDAIVALSSEPKRERQASADSQKAECEPTIAEQIDNLESLLSASPTHSQAGEWREQLAALKRKPVENEPGAKAQKAGQG